MTSALNDQLAEETVIPASSLTFEAVGPLILIAFVGVQRWPGRVLARTVSSTSWAGMHGSDESGWALAV
jgi:hypothetical protein